MDLIQRPKQVQKSERGYLTERNYQDYSEQQFNTVYDYLDSMVYEETTSKVIYKKDNNSSTTITLDESVSNFDYIEIFYRVDRGDNYNIRGSQKVLNPSNKYFNASVVFRNDSNIAGSATLYKINTSTIEIISSCNYQFSNGTAPVVNTNNAIYINQVIGYKRKEN